jgi:hypothetical protein
VELRRENEVKRKTLIDQFNTDIQQQVRRLNTESAGLTAEQRTDIEKKI